MPAAVVWRTVAAAGGCCSMERVAAARQLFVEKMLQQEGLHAAGRKWQLGGGRSWRRCCSKGGACSRQKVAAGWQPYRGEVLQHGGCSMEGSG
jgi:hypothetical protein